LFGTVFLFLLSWDLHAQQILVSPYIQPGNAYNLSREEKVVVWQTDGTPGDFEVQCTQGEFSESSKIIDAKVSSINLDLNNEQSIIYRAEIRRLKFDEVYSYRVSLDGKIIATNTFKSRTKEPNISFAVFGDCGAGTVQQARIANQVYQLQPEFVLITGDIVYSRGLENEYRRNYFPYYNAKTASAERGVPLMSSIPFYTIIGNHDIYGADLDKYPAGLAYFYYSDLPLNAPIPQFTVEAKGESEKVKAFKKNTGSRYPKMSNYSFDYGNVHVVCLDANLYINPLDPALVQWLRADLGNSKADWKVVAYHHPGFNGSKTHYEDQQMRLQSALMEELKVDLILSGHVHNYQRSFPLKFEPKLNENKTQYIISREGLVDGKFTLDKTFDGITNTKPDGIIYVISGAGGAGLYDTDMTDKPETWKHEPPENWEPFTSKLISDKHSFTFINTDGKKLTLKQIDENGSVLDEIVITK
jgi:predicted MPP superfamily phosphohydrolase